MKVELKSLNEEAYGQRWGDILEIEIDGKRVFSAMDGEPEDNTLSRNFSDCWSVPDLMEQAHKAGSNGESFEIVKTKVSLEEI